MPTRPWRAPLVVLALCLPLGCDGPDPSPEPASAKTPKPKLAFRLWVDHEKSKPAEGEHYGGWELTNVSPETITIDHSTWGLNPLMMARVEDEKGQLGEVWLGSHISVHGKPVTTTLAPGASASGEVALNQVIENYRAQDRATINDWWTRIGTYRVWLELRRKGLEAVSNTVTYRQEKRASTFYYLLNDTHKGESNPQPPGKAPEITD